jgi:hypothetical protein
LTITVPLRLQAESSRIPGSPALSILLANSRPGSVGRNLGKMGRAGEANPELRALRTNSPAVSSLMVHQLQGSFRTILSLSSRTVTELPSPTNLISSPSVNLGSLLAIADVPLLLIAAGARERTQARFRDLPAAAGLRLTRIVPTGSPMCVIEGVAEA